MTENGNEKDNKKSVIAEKVNEKPTKADVLNRGNKNSLWIVWVVIGAVLFFVGIAAVGAVVVHRFYNMHNTADSTLMRGDDRMESGFRGGYWSQEFRRSQTESDGLNSTTTTTTYVTTLGVVTVVDANSVTVAGGGKSQKIVLNSDTDYTGDKPVVNDTVAVTSSKADDGTLTATTVRILN